MNHIQRALELRQRIPELKKLQAEKNKLDDYMARKDSLISLTEGLAGLVRIAEELRSREVEVTGFKVSAQGMQRENQRIAAAFRDDKTVINAPENVETFWAPLKSMPGKVKKELEKAWKSYVGSQIPSGQTDVLDVLSRVQGFAAQTDKVLRLRTAMRDLGLDLPQDGDFVRLDELAQLVKQAWHDLDGDGLPPAVLTFLKKAHQNGISLADMDDNVFDWLRKQNLLGTYIVRGR